MTLAFARWQCVGGQHDPRAGALEPRWRQIGVGWRL